MKGVLPVVLYAFVAPDMLYTTAFTSLGPSAHPPPPTAVALNLKDPLLSGKKKSQQARPSSVRAMELEMMRILYLGRSPKPPSFPFLHPKFLS